MNMNYQSTLYLLLEDKSQNKCLTSNV
jgi:hypothetical protein